MWVLSEIQVLTLVLATVPTMVVVLVGILVNNVRLTDLRESLRAEIKMTREVLEATMEKNHSEMLHRFGDLDTRIGRLETDLGTGR